MTHPWEILKTLSVLVARLRQTRPLAVEPYTIVPSRIARRYGVGKEFRSTVQQELYEIVERLDSKIDGSAIQNGSLHHFLYFARKAIFPFAPRDDEK